ncbi:hypothetical protein HQ560_16445 [bacterium]|nr:hypothetical protein [bacterium]
MTYWQQNRLFVIVTGAAFIALVFFWPSLLDLGPTIVSLHSAEHNGIRLASDQNEKAINKFFGDAPGSTPVAAALAKVAAGNEQLLGNFEKMNHWMSFVPRFPFRIPEIYQEKNQRQKYVSSAYTYVRTGELACKAYGADGEGLRDPSDGIVFVTASRNIGLQDPNFGLNNMEMPETIEDPETRIMQLALIHELGHLAIRLGVDEIVGISPEAPYTWGSKDVDIATAYPVRVRLECDLPTLTRYIHALDGAHGVVVEAVAPEESVDPTQPVGAAPAAAKDDPAAEDDDPDDDEAPAPVDAAPGRTIAIQFVGAPSLHHPNPKQRSLKERVTLFSKVAETSELTFVANATITRLLGKGEVEAVIEDLSDMAFPSMEEPTARTVRAGDFAVTRFFLVRSLKAEAVPAKVERDKSGFPTEVTPAHLAVDLSVAALRFKELKLPKAAVRKGRQREGIPHYVGY